MGDKQKKNSIYNLYVCDSFNKGLGKVFFSREGDGWKLDVQDKNEEWIYGDGDQFEITLDEIIPYLKRFVNSTACWKNTETGELTTFWDIVSDNTINFD